jgi:hypothetical protein
MTTRRVLRLDVAEQPDHTVDRPFQVDHGLGIRGHRPAQVSRQAGDDLHLVRHGVQRACEIWWVIVTPSSLRLGASQGPASGPR